MPLYSYKAADASGKICKGLQAASSMAELESHLERQALYLIRASENRGAFSISRKKVCRRDLITFFFNMEHLLNAGVPLLDCLTDLRDSMDATQFRSVIGNLLSSIESGSELSQAMSRHPHVFGKIIIGLVHAGETSGRLPEVFRHITNSLKWHDEFVAQTRNMMIYPAFAGTLILAAILFLLLYLVPQLAGFLNSMGQAAPWQTSLLLDASGLFVGYWHVVLGLLLLTLAIAGLALKYHPPLLYHLDMLKLQFWPVGPILRKIILARFANTFAMMYASGISILDCISNSRDLAGNRVIARSIERAAQEIEAGRNLTQSFSSTGIFPPLVVRMLRVGETSGQLDTALRNVSYFYERDVKESVARLQALLEPVMTIILGALLGCVMLFVLSPIYNIIGRVAP